MKQWLLAACLLFVWSDSYCWGFYAHRLVNYYAVFLLPPEMMVLYKKQISFLSDHAVDPDKRRYAMAREAPRHYIDIDRYGAAPYAQLPRSWAEAVAKYGSDSLNAHGIVPWWIPVMMQRLTRAFREGDGVKILRLSAELGHYVADAHVPLHTSSNHNGELTDQVGIHGFWESRVPELLAEKEWDFLLGKAAYLADPAAFIWKRVLESAAEADSVLRFEKSLNDRYPPGRKYAFETRGTAVVKQYSTEYSLAYNAMLNDMVQRRFRQSVASVAACWYTAWVNAGKPRLDKLAHTELNETDSASFRELDNKWQHEAPKGKICE